VWLAAGGRFCGAVQRCATDSGANLGGGFHHAYRLHGEGILREFTTSPLRFGGCQPTTHWQSNGHRSDVHTQTARLSIFRDDEAALPDLFSWIMNNGTRRFIVAGKSSRAVAVMHVSIETMLANAWSACSRRIATATS